MKRTLQIAAAVVAVLGAALFALFAANPLGGGERNEAVATPPTSASCPSGIEVHDAVERYFAAKGRILDRIIPVASTHPCEDDGWGVQEVETRVAGRLDVSRGVVVLQYVNGWLVTDYGSDMRESHVCVDADAPSKIKTKLGCADGRAI